MRGSLSCLKGICDACPGIDTVLSVCEAEQIVLVNETGFREGKILEHEHGCTIRASSGEGEDFPTQ